MSARLLIGSRFTPSQILALKPKTETWYRLDLEGHMEPTQKDFTPGLSDLSNFLHCHQCMTEAVFLTLGRSQSSHLKFMFSKKATKNDKTFTVNLTLTK